jgi:tetratricopeptide (TPR) repeat protein
MIMIPANWVTTFLALLSLALLYWQGWELLDREEYSSRLGVLTISLTGLAALLQALLFTGKLVFNYDLHVLMAEGPFVGVGLGVFLMGVTLAAAFGWLISVTDRGIKWILLIGGAGLFVGVIAITQIDLLNPDDFKPLRVYSFDLLQPGFLSWLAFCFTQTALGRNIRGHKLLRTLLAGAVSCCVISLPQFYDRNGISAWWALFLLGLFLAMLLLGWWTVARARLTGKHLRALAYFSVIAGATAVTGLGLPRLYGYHLLLSATAVISGLSFLGIAAYRVPANQFSARALNSSMRDLWKFGRPIYLSRLRWAIQVRKTRLLRHWVLWAVLVGVFGGFFIASYLASTDPRFRLTGLAVGPGLDCSVGFSGLIFMWVLLIEIFGMGPLTADHREPPEGEIARPRSPAQRLWNHLSARSRAYTGGMVSGFSALARGGISTAKRQDAGAAGDGEALISGAASENAQQKTGVEPDVDAKRPQAAAPSTGNGPKLGVGAWFGGWTGAVVKTLVGVAILIAISEFPNSHETLIETFHTPKFTESETEEDVGQAISDEIIDSLARIGKQLQPLVIGLPADRAGPSQFRTPSTGDLNGGVSEALAKGTNLGLPGGVSVPLNLLLMPIQAPMRWLLGVRVIRGSLHQSDEGFTLLANSSNGQAWEVPFAGKSLKAAVPVLAERMAFEIAIRDPSFDILGMGKKWDGFKQVELGQESWDAYQARNDLDELTKAIKLFREATETDPDFALAYYRLGLALQKQGDSAGAVEALRGGVRANRHFVPGYVALASTLQDFDFFRRATAAIAANPSLSEDQLWAQRGEARDVWQKVATFPSSLLTLSDQAAAYYGLCRDNLGLSKRFLDRRLTQKSNDFAKLAYFHCDRAEELLARLPASLREMPLNRQNEASAINNMGIALYNQESEFPSTDWICSEDSFDVDGITTDEPKSSRVLVGPRTRVAMRYFNLAEELQPDDQVIACNAALASYGLGDKAPMERLEQNPAAHLNLGDSFGQIAKDQARPLYYLLALREYRRAMELDPDRIMALNDFAYAFWQFRLAFPFERIPGWAGTDVGRVAEESARRAGFLAAQELTGSERINVQSTLGEVLLGQARTEEAVREIEKWNLPANSLPRNSLADEVRWDLAQAYLCDSAQKKMHGKAEPEEEQKGAAALQEIRESAFRRDDEQWIDRLDALDPHKPQPACVQPILDEGSGAGGRFVLEGGKPVYSGATPCNWEGVSATVSPGEAVSPSNFQLHVWGGGTDATIKVASDSREQIPLEVEPFATQRTYFAQLGVQPQGTQSQTPGDVSKLRFDPVSEVIPIPTVGSTGTTCQQNSILLNFVPAH